ncbi:MAG: GNAT family N-acetyltransferase [Deltaproteobacteria bacterium]|nr:GNAT family N-acetyltransferase [Deltaproteobacteria bacterium]NCP03298.1 GNAT family N-acetyltransferase [Deltaproteobacteria bacterium]NCP78311.1 GNAT family N-acetyltransferase [Desulfuromonadales bacterium]
MLIEPAVLADIPALCELLSQLFEQEAEFTPDQAAQRRGLQMILTDNATGMILVAREGRQIVAMVNLLYTVSTALGTRVALLEDMVVAPSQRNCGLGSRLLDAAVRYARRNGCRRITLLTDSDNLSAQRFYQRQGFSRSSMIPLRLSLM